MVPHPIIVDFAVALLVVSVAFDILASIVEERDLRIVGWWTLMIGTVSAALAVVSGFAAAKIAAAEPTITETITLHRNLGIATLTCFVTCAVWRAGAMGTFPRRYPDAYWALTAVGLGTLIVTAYFGGILVFRLGVGFVTPV